jgi:hypothetical protein
MSQPRPTTLNFITGNANKLAEVRAILGEVNGLTLQSRDVAGAEIQGSIEEVARDKCSRAAAAVSLPCLLDPLFPRKTLGERETDRTREIEETKRLDGDDARSLFSVFFDTVFDGVSPPLPPSGRQPSPSPVSPSLLTLLITII